MSALVHKTALCNLFDQHHNDNQVGSQRHVLAMNEPQTQSSKDNLLSETGIILQPVALTNT